MDIILVVGYFQIMFYNPSRMDVVYLVAIVWIIIVFNIRVSCFVDL